MRVGFNDLVELELAEFLDFGEQRCPAGVSEAGLTAGRLHHAVE